MKPKLIESLLIAATLFVSAASQAQIDKPKIADAIRDMVKFIGMWQSEAIITIDSVPHNVIYEMHFRKTSDGFGIYMDEGFADSALGTLRASNLVGYNSEDSKIHWSFVDNMGNTRESTGGWTDSDNLRFQHDSTRKGKKYTEIITFLFHGNDQFAYKLIAYIESKEIKRITGRFERKKFAAPVKKQ